MDLIKTKSGWGRLSQDRKQDVLYLFILLISILVFFWRIVFHPDEMIYSPNSDTVEQFYPWHKIADDAVNGGSLPFWNIYNFGGEPLLANMQLGFFYLPNLILSTILPPHMVFGYSFILHLFFAGASIYFLAKRAGLKGISAFLPSVVFIFSGYFMGHIYAGHYGQVCSASWIPMVLLLLDTALRKESWRWGAALGAAVGVQFLAGHIQITLFSGFSCALYFIYFMIMERRSLKKGKRWLRLSSIPIIAVPIAFLIGLVQFIPTYQYTDATTRSGGMDYGWVTSYSLPPQNFLTLLLPNIFGTPVDGNYWHLWNYWELSFYMGLFTLVLIVLSLRFGKERYPRFFMVLGASSLVMALGRYTPIYWVFYKVVPGFDILRVPSRFVLIFILCASILAGFGLKRFMEELSLDTEKTLKSSFKVLLMISALIILISLIMTIFQDGAVEFLDSKIDSIITDEELLSTADNILDSAYVNAIREMITTLFLISVCAGILVWRVKAKCNTEHIGAVVVLFIIFNLGLYHVVLIDTRDVDDIYSKEPHIEFLVENSEGYRVYDASDILEDNFQIIYGFETVKGYNPLELEYYQQMTDEIRDLSENTHHPVLDLLGAKYIISEGPLTSSGFELVYGPDEDGIWIYENPDALPRAFLSRNLSVEGAEMILETLGNGNISLPDEVLIEEAPDGYPQSGPKIEGGEILEIDHTANNEICLTVDVPSSRILVLGQSYYEHWDVFIDGEEAELLRVYHALTGVHIGQGKHEVRFVYDDIF